MTADAIKELYGAYRKKAGELINGYREPIGWIAFVFVLVTLVIVFGCSIGADKASRAYRAG